MWSVRGVYLEMAEGDYGIALPVTVDGTTLAAGDSLKFTFKTCQNGDVVLEKDYTNIVNNTVELSFTESESAQFAINKTYVYALDWYKNGVFMCNLIPMGTLRVVDKA